LVAIILSLVVTFLRGNKKTKSLIEIDRCSKEDWYIVTLFSFCILVMTSIGIRINRYEQALKEKVGKGLVPSDIRHTGN